VPLAEKRTRRMKKKEGENMHFIELLHPYSAIKVHVNLFMKFFLIVLLSFISGGRPNRAVFSEPGWCSAHRGCWPWNPPCPSSRTWCKRPYWDSQIQSSR
jgi:hypothetical protein